jgi:hypothetical protein
MATVSESQLVENIFDAVYEAITAGPGGDLPPRFNRATTLVQLIPNGIPINPADYANLISFTNPIGIGDLRATRNFHEVVCNPVPTWSGDLITWAKSPYDVEGQYQLIMDSAETVSTPNPEAEQRWREAREFLYDADGNPNPPLKIYNEKRLDYTNAVSAKTLAYVQLDLSKPSDQLRWQAIAPILDAAIDESWHNWRAVAPEVEAAQENEDANLGSAVGAALARDKQVFDNSWSSPDLGDRFHVPIGLPSNWMDPSAAFYSSVSLKSTEAIHTSEHHYQSYGGGGGFDLGLWSVGGSAGHSESDSKYHSEATDVSVSFRMAVVDIVRPWLDGSFLGIGGWRIHDMEAGKLSTGDLNSWGASQSLQLLPVAFVVATDVKLTGNWSASDLERWEESTNASASVGWGPFSVGGSYASSDSGQTYSPAEQGADRSLPGLHIIAFIHQVVPYSPPISGVVEP